MRVAQLAALVVVVVVVDPTLRIPRESGRVKVESPSKLFVRRLVHLVGEQVRRNEGSVVVWIVERQLEPLGDEGSETVRTQDE